MGYSAWFDCSALHRFLASAGAETAWFDCEKVESSEKVGAGGFAVDLRQVEHCDRGLSARYRMFISGRWTYHGEARHDRH